jgi:uncharacterized coiled-coil DUF342 family protein
MPKLSKLISRIVRLETQREDHEKVHELEEKARNVAVVDMNRRLDDHNDVIAKSEAAQAKFVEMGWFERIHKELIDSTNNTFTDVDKRLTSLEASRNKIIAVVVASMVFGGFIEWLLGIWLKKP